MESGVAGVVLRRAAVNLLVSLIFHIIGHNRNRVGRVLRFDSLLDDEMQGEQSVHVEQQADAHENEPGDEAMAESLHFTAHYRKARLSRLLEAFALAEELVSVESRVSRLDPD